MKAVIVEGKADSASRCLEETDIPKIGANQVLVKVKAAALNPIDWHVGEEGNYDFFGLSLPYTMGHDVAGVIEQVGKDVDIFRVGDEVLGALSTARPGSFAEYVAIDTDQIVCKPSKLSFTEAAAVPLSGETAYQVLFDHLKIKAEEIILIQAAAGGVGTFAVQLAKLAGAFVVAIGSKKNSDFLFSLGADDVFDYHNGYHNLPGGFDAIFDCFGPSEQLLPLLKKGGRYASITVPANRQLADSYGVAVSNFYYNTNGGQLKKLVELIEKGLLKVIIDKTFPLANVAAGLLYQKQGHTRGKNVFFLE